MQTNTKQLMAFVWGSCWLLLAGCIDLVEIETPIEAFERSVVVEGLIHDGPGPYHFRFSYTATRGRNRFSPFSPVEAYVEDDLGNREDLRLDQPGQYSIPGLQLKGEVGRTYTLYFRSADGAEYRSTPETMLAGAKLDSIYFDLNYEENTDGLGGLSPTLFRNIMRVYIDVDLSGIDEPPFLRWDYQRWFRFTEPPQPNNPLFTPKSCYVQDDPGDNRVFIFDGRDIGEDRFVGQEVGALLADFKFNEGSVIALTQYSLSKTAFEYWQRVDRVVNQTGTIFDSPPAIVRGNISNIDNEVEEVLGFFQASAVDTLILRQSRTDLGLSLLPFCASAQANFYFSGGNPCANCLQIPGSTLEQPSFWD